MMINRYSVSLRLSCVALAAFAVEGVAAQTVVFNYTGAIETWTVPATGRYVVTAVGAQGGVGTISQNYVGGRGASVTGSFNLTAGQTYYVAVGGRGDSLPNNYNGGGGGGSFFVDASDSPLLVAGGGGGIRGEAGQNGCDASITAYGTVGSASDSTSTCAVMSSGLGLGGAVSGSSWGSGGAGFYGDGADDVPFGNGGSSWANGLLGGSGAYSPQCTSTGGFGGGGSGSGCGGGGGGGGYSGGAGGWIGGGGGSLNNGFNQSATAGVGVGDGRVTIQFLGAVNALAFNPSGVGHILYVPYFSTQSGNVTAINLVNTDAVFGKVVKVRFRGASNSDDLYDFQVFLSPGDVWTAGISQGADGRSLLTTTDKSCTLPASVNGSFITGRISPDGGVNETREGYVEILTMANIINADTKAAGQFALYTATKHVNGSAPCTASVLTALTHENARNYMGAPTTGLMANWTIINVQAGKYYAYSGDAAAIEARDVNDLPMAGNLVYWDQRSTPLADEEISDNTADPLIRERVIAGARYDLPDLSTPYLRDLPICPFCQARALSDAITVQQVSAEFYSEPTLGAQTDWVISFPTRRYFAAVDYADDDTPVYNTEGNIYFNEDNTEMGSAANGGKAWQLCSVFGANALAFYSREEDKSITDDIVISPGTPTQLSICGEVTVLGINVGASSATFGTVARTNVSNGFKEGWGSLATPSADGLPMLVRQFTRVNNTQTNVYYGMSYSARLIVPGNPPPFVP